MVMNPYISEFSTPFLDKIIFYFEEKRRQDFVLIFSNHLHAV